MLCVLRVDCRARAVLRFGNVVWDDLCVGVDVCRWMAFFCVYLSVRYCLLEECCPNQPPSDLSHHTKMIAAMSIAMMLKYQSRRVRIFLFMRRIAFSESPSSSATAS